MKKNNKAFTIVELLAVMVLLVTILIISYPNFSKMTENAKSKYDNSIKIIAKSGAKMYVNNNREEINTFFSSNPSGKLCIPLAKLAAYDYIDSFLKDSSGEIVDMKTCVNVTKKIENSKIKYNYELGSNLVSESSDYLPPILSVNKKDGATLDCANTMKVSKDIFNSNCVVQASDNKDTNVVVSIEEKTVGSNIVITYTATDSTGNKAKPLKVILINE